jgi:Secretion system C-terminal sorting domain
MKYQSLYIALLLCARSLHGQVAEFTTAIPGQYATSVGDQQIITDASGIYVWTDNYYSLRRYDLNGHYEYERGWEQRAQAKPQAKHVDNRIYYLVEEQYCDVGAPLSFYCMDSAGNNLWTYQRDRYDMPNQTNYRFIPATNQNWWVWRTGEKPMLIDGTNGQLLDSLDVNRPSITNYVSLPFGQTLTYGDSGLLRYDEAFTLTGTALAGQPIEEVKILDDKIVAYGASQLWLLHTDLTIIEAIDVSPIVGATGRIQLATRGERIFLMRFSLDNTRWYEYDLNLTLLQSDVLPDQDNLQPTGFALTANQWLIGGANHGYISVLKSVPGLYPFYQHNMDIELLRINIPDSIQRVGYHLGLQKYRATNVEFVLKNNSPTAIEACRIGTEQNLYFPDWCFGSEDQVRTITLPTLMPGDSMTYTWPVIEFSSTPSEWPLQSGEPRTMIFFADLPNDSLDASSSNSIIVTNFPVSTVSTRPNLVLENIQIAPNPAIDAVTITCNAPNWSLAVYDELGRTVHTATPDTDNYRLARHGLPAGVYAIRIQAGERAGVYRIVWQ